MTQTSRSGDPRTEFLEAALWHGSLERAQAILAAHPEVASSDIHTAAVLGDEAAVRRFVALDPACVTAKAPPYGGNALVYLCLSKYFRLDAGRAPEFLRAAAVLLAAGADPNSGFWTEGQHPEFESALYGAAGVAHHGAMTRLLLEWGADPNDVETAYHSPETRDNAALQHLVESGRLTADSLATMLIRKHDWHDHEGVRFLLEHGADPNYRRQQGAGAIHHAIARDNDPAIIELLLDHGADPTLVDQGQTSLAWAARRGRGDLLLLFQRRGYPMTLSGVERLIAACARNEAAAVHSIAEREPRLRNEIRAEGGRLLTQFAGNANTHGLQLLLDLGVDIGARCAEGDGYWNLAPNATALHSAAWRANHSTIKFLIDRGAEVNAEDAKGRTPLSLAVRACVDSYWSDRRTPESVEALLRAGARVTAVSFPSGYAEVDELLRRYGSPAS